MPRVVRTMTRVTSSMMECAILIRFWNINYNVNLLNGRIVASIPHRLRDLAER